MVIIISKIVNQWIKIVILIIMEKFNKMLKVLQQMEENYFNRK